MPEGDSIHHAARRIRPVLLGGPLDGVRTPSPRTAPKRWDRRLAGATVVAVEAKGKHLLIRFADGLVLHSHLRMTGSWSVRPDGARWPRAPRRAWLVLRRGGHDVIQFDGPFLELRTTAQVATDPRLAALGPDVCADGDLDIDRVLRRIRQGDPSRPVGDALLDQRAVAGIGNVWKCEGCWVERIDPTRPAGQVDDERIAAVLTWIQPRIRYCAEHGTHLRPKRVYGKDGRPCERCGTTIVRRGVGDENRPTFWCPGCQR